MCALEQSVWSSFIWTGWLKGLVLGNMKCEMYCRAGVSQFTFNCSVFFVYLLPSSRAVKSSVHFGAVSTSSLCPKSFQVKIIEPLFGVPGYTPNKWLHSHASPPYQFFVLTILFWVGQHLGRYLKLQLILCSSFYELVFLGGLEIMVLFVTPRWGQKSKKFG